MIDTKNPCVEFSANDRCDRCGAQAYASATKDGYELLFCCHHVKRHNSALELDGWTVGFDYVALEHIAPVAVYA